MADNLQGQKILLCVGGGIAAYKALEVVRRLREKLWSASAAELGFVLEYSAGAATFTPRSDDNLEALMARADAALYKAKAQGRARLVVDGQHLPEALEPVG